MKKILGRLYVVVAIIGIAVILYFAFMHYRISVAFGVVSEVEKTSALYGPVTIFKLAAPYGVYYLGSEGHDLDVMDGDRALVGFYRWSAVARRGNTNYYKIKDCNVTSR